MVDDAWRALSGRVGPESPRAPGRLRKLVQALREEDTPGAASLAAASDATPSPHARECLLSDGGVATIQDREHGPALVSSLEDCEVAVRRLSEALGADSGLSISIDLEGSLGVSRYKAATVDLVQVCVDRRSNSPVP
jgi:hypothetical protein